jgi:glycosyltransferase involved in cell wall biosynthesis
MLGDYPFKCVPLHLELADIVVATSRRIKGELSALGEGRFDWKILVKPNGIDTDRFPNVDPAERLAQDRDPELISVSRIEPKKGLTYLVAALGMLRDRGISVRLNIVGGVDPHTTTSAEYFREVTARIEALGLADRVVLHGSKQQHEFVSLLARSRIFVAPYVEMSSGDKDGIPTAVLEAMSTGLPVVATNAGSLTEAVTDGIEALLVPQRDPERLADAIERLLTDRGLYVRMADAARRRAVSEFDVHVTEKPLHERIRACLAQSSPPGPVVLGASQRSDL